MPYYVLVYFEACHVCIGYMSQWLAALMALTKERFALLEQDTFVTLVISWSYN